MRIAASVAIVAAAIAGLSAALFPAPLPTPHDADYVDNIFNSRPIVWIARLALVSAAVVVAVASAFAVASTAARMRNGDWLRRAGPFEVEVSETTTRRVASEEDDSDDRTHDGHGELNDLRVHLAVSSAFIEKLMRERRN